MKAGKDAFAQGFAELSGQQESPEGLKTQMPPRWAPCGVHSVGLPGPRVKQEPLQRPGMREGCSLEPAMREGLCQSLLS